MIRHVPNERTTARGSDLALNFVEPMSRIRSQRRTGNGGTLVFLAVTRRSPALIVAMVRHS